MFRLKSLLFDLGQRDHAAVPLSISIWLGEGIDDLVNVLARRRFLLPSFTKPLTGVDHEDARAGRGRVPCQHHDAGGDAGAVEQVGRQADDALDVALPQSFSRMVGLGIAAEQHAVGQITAPLPVLLSEASGCGAEGVVAVLLGRDAVLEAAELIVGRFTPWLHALSEKGGLATTKSKVLRVPFACFQCGAASVLSCQISAVGLSCRSCSSWPRRWSRCPSPDRRW
jgi:hypothetical protein